MDAWGNRKCLASRRRGYETIRVPILICTFLNWDKIEIACWWSVGLGCLWWCCNGWPCLNACGTSLGCIWRSRRERNSTKQVEIRTQCYQKQASILTVRFLDRRHVLVDWLKNDSISNLCAGMFTKSSDRSTSRTIE